MKIKVLQIDTPSSSLSVKDYKNDIYRSWNAQVGFELKKKYPSLDVECWTPERMNKKEETTFRGEIKFRTFPTTLSIRHGMEISLSLLKAIQQEQKNLKKGDKLILHLHEYHSWLVYSILLIADKSKTRIICQHHGGRSPIENLKKYKRLLFGLPIIILMQIAENKLFKKADVFYPLSDFEIRYLRKIAPKSKIKFQTMGIGDEYFEKHNKDKMRKKLGLEKSKKYVLYIGRIKTTKGIRELLDAMNDLQKEEEKVELLLIGEGTDFNKYLRYAKENRIKNIRFLGDIRGKRKIGYISACDCLILPSHTEGAPVVLMEAVAGNLPVIATGVGGIKKMIENGREGLIIRKESKKDIVRAIKEILTWKKKEIRKYAEKYRWKNIVSLYPRDYQI